MLVADYLRPIAFKLAVLQEGVKTRFGFHTLRHSLASFLANQGENPTVVQKTLRHANVSATLGLCSHVAGDDRLTAQRAFYTAASETVH
jgi:site-specific recombinase XerD